MSRFIVQCLFNGTSLKLNLPARNAAVAIDKAKHSRLGRKASAFIVIDRKLNAPINAVVNK